MLISFAYRLTRKILGAATLARCEVSGAAEVLVLRHENAVLRRQVKKVCYWTEDRLWFAALSGLIPRRRWAAVFSVNRGTLLVWHRTLVVGKYTTAPRRPGRQPTCVPIRSLVIRMATENPMWGHRRVQASWPGSATRSPPRPCGASCTTPVSVRPRVAAVRPGASSSPPGPRHSRGRLVHVDTVLLKRIYALILIEHGSRRVHLFGISANPDGAWTAQAARNVLMVLGERANAFTFVIRDRGGRFTGAFDVVLADVGIRVLKSPPRAPRANAICERMIGALRRELFDRILILGERHLRLVLTEFFAHYNGVRPHRTLCQFSPHQAEIALPAPIDLAAYRLRRKPVLGGLTGEYRIAA